MHLSFLKDIFKIFRKSHITFRHRLHLIRTFVSLKHIQRKGFKHSVENPIKMLGFKVYTDNFNDFFATFYEMFIKEEYLFKNYNKADVLIDAGANIGLATLYFKWIRPKVKIIGFEMDADTFSLYKKNVIANKLGDVSIHQFAIGGRDGEVASYGSRRATTLFKTVADELAQKADPDRRRVVKMKKLSTFIPKNLIVYLKMDIEGAEMDVLKELSTSGLLQSIKEMIFEFHLKEDKMFYEASDILKESGLSVTKGGQQKNGFYMVTASSL